MISRKTAGLVLGFLGVLLAFGILAPNSFGNVPDLIQDESYFLTTALSSLERHTLPGWEFSESGAYYGGVQAYLDTAAIVPAVAVMLISHDFSLDAAKIAVALHTGDLLYLLRLVNGAVLVLSIVLVGVYLYRRNIPKPLAESLLLVALLVFGNTLIVGLAHTAKVWTIALLIDLLLGAAVIIQEYYRAQKGSPFFGTRTYAAILVWGGTLGFFQNFIGIASAGLWTLYALFLKHLSINDLLSYVWRRWYLLALAIITQVSFIYRGIIARTHPSVLDLADNSTYVGARGGTIDWFHRLYDPVVFALQSQPLVLLFILGAILALIALMRYGTGGRKLMLVALAHPILTWLIFHALLGFSVFPRFSIMLAVACSFSIAMLALLLPRFRLPALGAALILFVVVMVQSVHLYWHPSSALTLTRTIEQEYNAPEETFIIGPETARFSLPVNAASLARLNERRAAFSRFAYLREREIDTSWHPLVLYADTTEEYESYLAEFSGKRAWVITQDCLKRCSAEEAAAGSCRAVNEAACNLYDAEGQKEYPVNLMLPFLSEQELGIAYFLRQVP